LTIREADQDSYNGLIAAAEGYWRAFQTNGTPEYHRASLMPDVQALRERIPDHRNGARRRLRLGRGGLRSGALHRAQTCGIGATPVVDPERGIVLSIVRFGLKGRREEPEHGHHQRPIGRRVLRGEETA
jgi:hypothetical protein